MDTFKKAFTCQYCVVQFVGSAGISVVCYFKS